MTKGPLVRQPDAAEPLRANRQASPLACRPLVSRLSCGHFQHDRHESGSGGCGVAGGGAPDDVKRRSNGNRCDRFYRVVVTCMTVVFQWC